MKNDKWESKKQINELTNAIQKIGTRKTTKMNMMEHDK